MERNWRSSLESSSGSSSDMNLLLVPGGVISHLHFLPLWKGEEVLTASKSASAHDPPTAGRREYNFLCIPLLPTSHAAPPQAFTAVMTVTPVATCLDALWRTIASVRKLTAFLTVSSSSPTWNYSLSVPSPCSFLWPPSTKMQEGPLHPLALVRIQCRHTFSAAALWNVELLLCWVVEKRDCTWVPLTFPTSGSVPGT